MKATLNRLAERAAEEGLLDVAYTTTDSPFGRLLLASTPRGLVRLGLPNQDADELLVELADRVSPRVLEAPAGFDQTRRLPAQGAAGDRPDPLRRDAQLPGDGDQGR
jgi:methylated-DNA-[protein]-cysteine S-methyltransferase